MPAKRALLIGNTAYDTGLATLHSARVDVEQLRTVLAHPEIGSYDVEVALDLNSLEIKCRLDQFLSDAVPGDTALVYMSGHGHRFSATTGEFVFLARDSQLGPLLGDRSVSATYINDRLENCRATEKIVILDACFSGGFSLGYRTRDPKAASASEPLLRSRGCYVISSSALDEVSYAGEPLSDDRVGPSVFTGYLVEALRTGRADRDGDGWVGLDELFDEVTESIRRNESVTQTPVKSVNAVTGSFRFAKRIRGVPPHVEPVNRSELVLAPSGGFDAAPSTPDPKSLLEYYSDCVKAAVDQFSMFRPTDEGNWYACAKGPERIIVGELDAHDGFSLPADDDCLGLIEAAESRSLHVYYGYPVVVLFDENGRGSGPSFAPLFMRRLHVSATRLLPDSEVGLHPALIGKVGPKLDATARAVLETCKPAWQSGHRSEARRQILGLLRDQLNMDAVLDLSELAPHVDFGTPVNRACNVGIYFLAPPSSKVTRNLQLDLRDMQRGSESVARTALGSVFCAEPRGRARPETAAWVAPPWTPCLPLPSNDNQLAVLRSAMSERLTVAMGPPGTGKSQLVANVIATCIVSKQRVLLATTNNRAVDVVCERLNELVPDALIRTGNKESQEGEREQLRALVRSPNAALAQSAHDATRLQLDAESDLEDLERFHQRLERAGRREQELLEALRRRTSATSALARDWDVDEQDVARILGARSLASLAQVIRWASSLVRFGALVRALLLILLRLPRRRPERAFQSLGAWANAERVAANLRPCTPEQTDGELRRGLATLNQKAADSARKWLAHVVHENARRGGEQITALSAPPSGRSWAQLCAALDAVPAWAVTALSARRLPLARESSGAEPPFDLVIVDEASQCHLPYVLPLLFRAQRALIIGDPMQLGPVGTLAPSREDAARSRAGLSAAWLDERSLTSHRYSAFDAARRAAGALLILDEHYRCHPHIAAFANEHFYDGKLITLTSPRAGASDRERAIEWVDATGAPEAQGTSWLNHEEARLIGAEVAELVASSAATVGVVSPLKGQRDLLARTIHPEALSPASATHGTRIAVGTVHTFQGGERDVILLSLVMGREMRVRTQRWLATQLNLWNVAVTRARSRLIVVGNRAAWAELGGIGARLLDAAQSMGKSDDPDEYRRRLHRKLKADGHDFTIGVEYGGYEADATVEVPGARVSLVIDRACGAVAPAKHLRIQLMRAELISKAAGHRVERVAAWRLFADGPLLLEFGSFARVALPQAVEHVDA